jgi:hypothetical protein
VTVRHQQATTTRPASRTLSPEDSAPLADAQPAFRPPPLHARAPPLSWRAQSLPRPTAIQPDRSRSPRCVALKQPQGARLGEGSHGAREYVGGHDPGVLALPCMLGRRCTSRKRECAGMNLLHHAEGYRFPPAGTNTIAAPGQQQQARALVLTPHSRPTQTTRPTRATFYDSCRRHNFIPTPRSIEVSQALAAAMQVPLPSAVASRTASSQRMQLRRLADAVLCLAATGDASLPLVTDESWADSVPHPCCRSWPM